jgi:5-methylcytosine-specific restriction protein A
MGRAAKKTCGKPGCPALTENGYCEKHQRNNPRIAARKQFDQQRGTTKERGYTGVWRRLRLIILIRDPFCMIGTICDPADPTTGKRVGRRAPSNEVDHIIPAALRPDLFYEETNLQGACKACHSHKTATEDSEFAKKKE